MGNLKLFRVLTSLYGIVVALLFGTYFISLFVHEDILLFKMPHRLEWVAGDVAVLFIILWGILFAFSVFWKRKTALLLCVFLAFILNILVGWMNWKSGNLSQWRVLGVSIVMLLFLLPSIIT
ncbi:MAG: hypothetical protein H5T61_10510, partial [Thermoflexales bacterium]|nr:hypothetical protein [Thermoflexales bacterium]